MEDADGPRIWKRREDRNCFQDSVESEAFTWMLSPFPTLSSLPFSLSILQPYLLFSLRGQPLEWQLEWKCCIFVKGGREAFSGRRWLRTWNESDFSLKWIRWDSATFVPTGSSFIEVTEWWHGGVRALESRIYYLYFPRQGRMPCHTGLQRKCQALEYRSRGKGKAWARRAFIGLYGLFSAAWYPALRRFPAGEILAWRVRFVERGLLGV